MVMHHDLRGSEGGYTDTSGSAAAPPGPAPAAQQPPTGRLRRGLVLVVVAALCATAGYGIGRSLNDDASPASESATTQVATSGPVTTAPTAVAPTVAQDAAEPVAAVAAALLPSTVQIETADGLGSGFIYDGTGYILTAAHVVDGYRSVTVRLSDGTALTGTVVGTDAGTDVAVVEIDYPGLQAAELAIGVPLQVGQLAVALGSPFGLDNTVTAGVVSSVGQPLQDSLGTVRGMIQTDAAINPGNSGGPLVNRDGQVIGVNDSIFTQSGGNEGVGFAIPIDTAKQVADKLVAGEPVTRAVLGVSGTDPAMGTAGALIADVVPGSAAAAAGLQVGDIVVGVDEDAVGSFVDLAVAIAAHQPGDQVSLQILRGDSTVDIQVVLGEAS